MWQNAIEDHQESLSKSSYNGYTHKMNSSFQIIYKMTYKILKNESFETCMILFILFRAVKLKNTKKQSISVLYF